ncbi:MAG: nickel-dependent lactate racemase [Clostridiaceae bacterium]|jgi:nickel-dependent lactate racemase|nr:nickel-dependent lactate racemase [Clostridiaceae bacterium]
MPVIEINIGKCSQQVEIDAHNLLSVLMPNEVSVDRAGEEAIEEALDHPIGTEKLETIVQPGESIVIVTSDNTRPMPSSVVLPHVLARLQKAGVRDEDVTIVFALGAHRKQTEEEKKYLVGTSIYERFRTVDSDPEDVIRMGMTRQGTPVDITTIVARADRRICLGNIEYHYFAGYSGGAKAIMPGVSTRDAITFNHRLMVEEASHAGSSDDNPVRKDLEEALHYCPVDFILNVVLNEKKEIVYAVAGDVIKAHRKGAQFLDEFYLNKIEQLADIVIVSQGGFPKDLNLYQTQKALDNAQHAVRENGIIILVGACNEGLGDNVFSQWMLASPSPAAIIERLRKGFVLGGHKAAAIALILQKADIYLVSEMSDALVDKMFMKPFSSVQEAYDSALKTLGDQSKVIVMPFGGSTLPKLTRGDENE